MVVGVMIVSAQDKKVPEKLVIPTKAGNITFDHSAHVQRDKGDCKVCHPSLFAEDSKAPLNFKPAHKKEENKKTSCGFCHRAGGGAFETKGNCTDGKCHVKAAAR